MHRVSYKSYCDKNLFGKEDIWSMVSERGRTVFAGITCPVAESSNEACERAVSVACRSFMRRPSKKEIAVIAIDEFINEAIYPLQLPRVRCMCSTAFMYVCKGQLRYAITGNSMIFHFVDGRLESVLEPESDKMYGESLKWETKVCEPIDVTAGHHDFLLCCNKVKTCISEEAARKIYENNRDMKDNNNEMELTEEEALHTAMLVSFGRKK